MRTYTDVHATRKACTWGRPFTTLPGRDFQKAVYYTSRRGFPEGRLLHFPAGISRRPFTTVHGGDFQSMGGRRRFVHRVNRMRYRHQQSKSRSVMARTFQKAVYYTSRRGFPEGRLLHFPAGIPRRPFTTLPSGDFQKAVYYSSRRGFPVHGRKKEIRAQSKSYEIPPPAVEEQVSHGPDIPEGRLLHFPAGISRRP